MTVTDNVNHPPHYTFGSIEVIDAIEDWELCMHKGNAVKYIARSKHKGNEIEDLKKAVWYLNRKIQNLKTAAKYPQGGTPKVGGQKRRAKK